ncbi:MAG: hypothetical protein IJN11_05815, partial [Oscillospiraceae bacterium]|nr:hypothetical protein [Oscillospiraceae bacterium]
MKKFLSALTAFCMSASLIVGSLPASALKVVTDDSVKSEAGALTWTIESVTADPGDIVPVHVYVTNDPGTAGYDAAITVDGRALSTSDLTIEDIMQGNDDGDSETYLEFGMFAANPDTGSVASSRGDGLNSVAVDGDAVYVMYFNIPENATDGTVYTLEFSDLVVSNGAYEVLDVTTVGGTITVGEAPTTTTQSTPAAETTTEGQGSETKPPVSGNDHTWYVEKVVANAGDIVPVHVYVANDPGTAGYDVGLKVDGGALSASDLTIEDIMQGNDAGDSETYLEFGMFA